MRTVLIATLLAATATTALAQQPPRQMRPGIAGDRATPVAAGSYAIEPNHTQVNFAVSHMGISPFAGWLSQASGTLTLDPARPTATQLTVSLPVTSLQTTSAKLDEELRGADWFDTAKYPTATFVSSKVTMLADDAAQIDGTLTLHGVSKPAVLRARLFGSAVNPMSKKPSIGFVGRMFLKRSDFGVSKYVPMVSDTVELIINAAFEKK